MRLIDSDALKEKLYSVDPENDGSDGCTVILLPDTFTSADMESMIEEMPTVNAVPVVRCKDCIYWENGKDYEPCCNNPENGLLVCPKADDFCSYGERKTE